MKLGALLFALTLVPAAATAQSAQPTQTKWCSEPPNPQFKTLHQVSLPDTWFKVYQVAPATFAIQEPRQSEGTISYLIVGSKGAALFDTGMGIGDLKKITGLLTKLPIIVMNSHTHDDHVGSNWQFDTVYGMDTDFTRTSAQGSSVDAQQEIAPSQYCGPLPEGFNASTYATRPWKIAKYIHDGEMIDLGGRFVQVIATPGHTPDAISLFDRVNGLLFTGDTFYPGTIWLYRPETNLDAYEKSVQRLAALSPLVKHVLGAHDFPLAPPSVLPNLLHQFEAVRAGSIAAKPAGEGKSIYKAEGISFLMRSKD
jgi:glyoxylase-like metal-dependent hydrolase (beta-lactamase superfamily II)